MARGVVITGLKRHLATLGRVTRKPPEQADKALMKGGRRIERTAKQSIIAGAVSGKGHVPAPPGEPPNADSHELDRSITTERQGVLAVDVIAKAPYSSAVDGGWVQEREFGTVKAEARPFMRPAAEKERAAITADIAAAVRKGVE